MGFILQMCSPTQIKNMQRLLEVLVVNAKSPGFSSSPHMQRPFRLSLEYELPKNAVNNGAH